MTRQEIQKQKDALSRIRVAHLNKLENVRGELSTIDSEIAELDAQLANENWMPEKGGAYFFLDAEGDCFGSRQDCTQIDRQRIECGNCYLSRAQAERHTPVIVAFRKMLKQADESLTSIFISEIATLDSVRVERSWEISYRGKRD